MRKLAAFAWLLVACGETKAPPSAQAPAGSARPVAPQPSPLLRVDLPVVDGFTHPALEDAGSVVVTPTSIVVDGTAIVALTAGRAEPSELQHGLKIPRLSTYLAAYHAQHPQQSLLPLAIDKAVPYHTFVEVVVSAKQREAGFKRFTLLAKTAHGALAEAPFTLPDKPAASVADPDPPRRRPGADLNAQLEAVRAAGQAVKVGDAQAKDKELAASREDGPTRPRPDDEAASVTHADLLVGEPDPSDPDRPVRLAVAIAKSEVLLWSFSGLEGTLARPKLTVPLDGAGAPLRAALEEIVARRWRGRQREQSILIMADGDTPMQRVAEIVAAVRATAGGEPLFPDLIFSSGFE